MDTVRTSSWVNGAAISLASRTFSAIKKSVETGREMEDIGLKMEFLDAKDQLAAASVRLKTNQR